MKKTIATFLAVSALALSVQAQTVANSNTVKAVNGPLLLQGTNASGVPTQSVSISNVGHISGRSMELNGADGISANKITLSNGGTISGTAQVVTIDAVGNGNVVIKDSTQVQGNVTASGTISSSQAIQTTGTGSINSAYGLTAAGGKFNVAGDTGNVSTTGSVNVNGKVNINGSNGNIVTTGVFNANGKAIIHGDSGNIDTVGTVTTNRLTVNSGARIGGGLDVTNAKITRVATGTDDMDAVNVGQLKNTVKNATDAVQANVDTLTNTVTTNATTAATATALVQTNLDNEATRAKGVEAGLQATKADKVAVAAAISAEENARIAGDVAVLNSANNYTDSKIVNQSASDRAYTDKAVTGERDRAMAAEAALSKETKQVGAMAMAAAGVAGATPVGDKKTAATVALGSYSGQTAIAVGVSHLIKENTRVFGAFSKVTGGKTGVTVGASFSF